MPFLIFSREFVQQPRNKCEAFDEGAIKIEKAEDFSYLRSVFGYRPRVDAGDFCGVHTCHPLFKDYPQVIHGGRVKETFLRLEIEVGQLSDCEDVVDCSLMIGHVCTGSDPNVVHVDSNCRAKGFMFEDSVAVDVVHHSLEGCW